VCGDFGVEVWVDEGGVSAVGGYVFVCFEAIFGVWMSHFGNYVNSWSGKVVIFSRLFRETCSRSVAFLYLCMWKCWSGLCGCNECCDVAGGRRNLRRSGGCEPNLFPHLPVSYWLSISISNKTGRIQGTGEGLWKSESIHGTTL